MWIKFLEVLLLLLWAGHCGGLASPENQKAIGNSQSGFDGIRKA
jgi:hypothetical protein